MPEENVIPLELAQEWAARWRNSGTNEVKAYWIPKIDVTEILEKEEVANIRGYLGIDDLGEFKMMLVGVDENDKDLIDYEKGHFVYDFTQACPNFCDIKSPLFTL
jgi:hypothetical protein